MKSENCNLKSVNYMKQYIAPQLTVVSFKAERGYALSGLRQENLFDLGFLQLDMESGNYDGYNAQCQQNWDTDEGIFDRW